MVRKGFTLVELLVVMFIIGILAAIVIVNVQSSRAKARDSRRKADLKSIQTAVEQYADANGQYPSTNGQWCGEATSYLPGGTICTFLGSGTPWVPGVSPTFISVLPHDPGKNSANICGTGDRGYLFRSDGVNYKILAYCTVEQTLSSTDAFIDPRRDCGSNATIVDPGTACAYGKPWAMQISNGSAWSNW